MKNYKKKPAVPFHSFWLEEEQYEPLTKAAYAGNFGFLFDLSDSSALLPSFDKPDCLYSELSFIVGYKEFNERTKTRGSFKDYITGLGKLIWKFNVPVYFIGHKKALQSLKPDRIIQIKADLPVETFAGYLAIWRDDEINVTSRTETLLYMNEKYHLVYDPCCGYLSIARLMPNCKFIFSDVNPKCIGGALATLKELNDEKTNPIDQTTHRAVSYLY